MRDSSWLPAALGAALVALVGTACPSQAEPNGDALAAYLARHGVTRPEVAAGDAPAPTPEIARRVALTVERATGLPDLDSGPGVTDPYVILEYEGQRYRTSVVEGSREPVWGDTFIFDVRPGGVLAVRLMDEDSLSSDEQIGTLSQTLPDLAVGETRQLSLSFRNGEGGTLTLTLTGMVRP